MTNKNAYAQSGVDVEAGYEVVERIKKHVARTERAGVMGALGGFGGMFDLSQTGVKEPVLISGTDGVGTKLMLAIQYDKRSRNGAAKAPARVVAPTKVNFGKSMRTVRALGPLPMIISIA